MYFQLFMFGIWIAYVTSNEYKIEYATDYKREQDNYVISFHDYRREKRQVENSWSPSTTAHTNLTIIPTTQTYSNVTRPTTQIHSNVTRPATQINSNVTRPTTQIHSNVTRSTTHINGNVTNRPTTQIHSNLTRPTTNIHSNVTTPTHINGNVTNRPTAQIHSNLTRPTTNIHSNVTTPTHINGNVTNRPTTQIHSNLTRPTTNIHSNVTTPTHINGNVTNRPTTQIHSNLTRPTTNIHSNVTTPTHINGNVTNRPTTQINGNMTTKPTTKVSGILPSTTNTPSTTRLPSTTKAPSTTREAMSITTTTISKETTFNPPETTYIKQSNTYQYYNSTVIHDGNGVYWDELENHTTHVVLSDAKYLSSAGLNLPFTMPFYGHNISKVQLTTGGFIYMAPFVHKFLTYSQYVAPLMANFDTQTDNSDILYKKYNDSVVIEWRNVHLNDQRYRGSHIADGHFRFQAKLFQNGSIMLVYKTIPAPVMNISTDNHPVKLGISDAFYMDYTQNGVRYRRIYKYHAVDIEKSLITNNTVVIFHPLPTCNLATSCDHCVSRVIDFDCSWCPSVRRCSNGYDWYRQEWSESECWEKAGNTTDICKATTVASTTKLTTQSTTTTIPTKPPITTRTPSTSTPPTTTTTTPPSTPSPATTVASTVIPTTQATTKITQVASTPSTKTTTIPTTSTITPSTSTTSTSTTQSTKTPTTTKPTTTKSTTTPTTTTSTTTPTTTKSTTTPTITTPTTTPTKTVSSTTISSPNQPHVERHTQSKESYNKAAVIVPIVLFLLLIIGLVGSWVYYAYTHPNTSAGQWLIEHRPSQLKSRFSDMFKRSTETGEKYKVKNEDIEFNMDESVA